MPAQDKDVELNRRIVELGGSTDALYSSNGAYDTPEALRRIHQLEAQQREVEAHEREARMEQLQKDSVDIARRALRASWAAVIASAVAIMVSLGAAFF